MCRRPVSTMTRDAAGNTEPTMTQHISTAQKARMRARRVSGGRPNRGVGLFCARSMLRFNGCLFRLGDIGPTYDLATAHDHGPEAPRVLPLTHTKPLDREAMWPDPCGHTSGPVGHNRDFRLSAE